MSADYILKIDGIKGESNDHIEILSFSWGETNSGSHAGGQGGGSGKVMMQDFHFTMVSNIASPELFHHCATGKPIKEALLTCRKQGGKQQEYLKIKFTDLIISSFQISGSGGSVIPEEQISFNYTKICYSYAEQKSDGTLASPLEKCFDLKAVK